MPPRTRKSRKYNQEVIPRIEWNLVEDNMIATVRRLAMEKYEKATICKLATDDAAAYIKRYYVGEQEYASNFIPVPDLSPESFRNLQSDQAKLLTSCFEMVERILQETITN